MKSKCFLLLIFLCGFTRIVFGQSVRPIYNITIYKSVNDENHKPDKFIEIDSAGNVYVQSGTIYSPKVKSGQTLNVKNLSMEINRYVAKEKPYKSPGDDFESKIEAPTIKLNEQFIEISIKFLDDIRKERALLNKTYYSWNDLLDKNIKDYPFFKYLNGSEIKILKALLE